MNSCTSGGGSKDAVSAKEKGVWYPVSRGGTYCSPNTITGTGETINLRYRMDRYRRDRAMPDPPAMQKQCVSVLTCSYSFHSVAK